MDRCQESIAAVLFVVNLLFVFTNVAVARESDDRHPNAVDKIERDTEVGSGVTNQVRALSSQQDVQIANEVHCLALNIYFEARGEVEKGRLAVGHVVMNRVADRHYPGTVCGVVRQGGEERLHRCQFSWWCDGQPDKPLNQRAWLESLKLAVRVYFGHSEDPTDGALWYHADYANPYWSDALVLGDKIGQHLFYLKEKQPKYASK